MPVEVPQFKVDPYQTTVPLVQLPMNQTGGGGPAQPLQGQFGKKGTGALAIGDSLLKGFMLGHQQKEQRKFNEAQASIGAVQAAEKSAWETYQNKLASGEATKDPKDPFYTAYLGAHNAATETMKKYTIPEKTKSTPKEGSKKALKTDKDPVKSPDDQTSKPQSFGEKLKGVLAANPHLFPQIALALRNPNPPGMTPQAQVQNLDLQTAQTRNQDENLRLQNDQQAAQDKKTYSEGKGIFEQLTPEQIKQNLANDPNGTWTTGYRAYEAARARLTPIVSKGPQHLYDVPVSGGGSIQRYMTQEEADTIPGSKVYQKPTTESQSNLYYDAAARAWGTTRDKLSVQQLEYVDAMRARSKAQSSGQTTYSYSTTDTSGNRSTTTRKVSDPIKPPAGLSPLPEKVFSESPADSQQASPTSGALPDPKTLTAKPSAQGVPATAPQGSTQFTVGAKPKGMVEEGNLPIWNRPTVQNADGKHSSEYSRSFEEDGKEVLVPTVVNGKFLTPDGKKPKEGSKEEDAMFKAAWQHYKDTGENLGKFANSKDADAYANTLHSRGEKKAGAKGPIAAPPQAGKTAKAGSQPGIPPPPGGKQTALTAQVTRQAVTKQKEGYRKAETQYQKDIEVADKAFEKAQSDATKNNDPSILATAQKVKDAQYELAKTMLQGAKQSIAEEYDATVRSIGGTPGSQGGSAADSPPEGASARVKDANGKLIGYAVDGQFVPLGQ